MEFSESIVAAILGSGLSRYRIAKVSGVNESNINRFVSGERGMTTDSLDKIARVLRLKVQCLGPRKELLRARRKAR